jgi:hypothetical protein
MTGDAEFADEEGIEGRVKCRGDLGGNRDPTTGKSEHDDVGTILVLA